MPGYRTQSRFKAEYSALIALRWIPVGGGGGGGVLWCFRTYVGSAIFGGLKFWISIFFGVLQKNEYFLGYEVFVNKFGDITKLDYIWRSFQCILGSFLKVNVQNRGYFFGLLKFQILLGRLKFLIFFFWGGGGWTVDAGPEPTYEEKIGVPHLGWISLVGWCLVYVLTGNTMAQPGAQLGGLFSWLAHFLYFITVQ